MTGDLSQVHAGVIGFDLDGVLVDVSRSFRVAVVRTVAALGGGAVTEPDILALKNEGGFNNDWDLSRELLRRRGVAAPLARVVDVFNDFYLGPARDGHGLIQDETWLLPPAQLEALAARHTLAIFTGRPRADAAFTLRHFRVEGYFQRVIALEDVARQKPDPAGLELMRAAFAPAALLAYIGDTVDDARCAAAAGVPFIAVLDPGRAHVVELATLFQATGAQRICSDASSALAPWLGGCRATAST